MNYDVEVSIHRHHEDDHSPVTKSTPPIFTLRLKKMLSLAEWRECGSPGIFTIRRNKGKGRVDYTHIQCRGEGYEVRMLRDGHIFYYWHATLDECGYSLERRGTATTLAELLEQ